MGKHRWPTAGDATRSSTPHPVTLPSTLPRTHRAPIRPGGVLPGGSVQEDAGTEDDAFGEWFEEDDRGSRPPVQWRVARSAALVFLGVALAVGGALFLVRSSEPSAAAVSVQLDPEVPAGASAPEGSDQENHENQEGGGAAGGVPGEPAEAGAAADRAIGGTAGATAPAGTVAPASSDPAGGGGTGQKLSVFYVTGAVTSPGVVTAPPGTRLFELIEQVGGPTPEADLEGINLAATPSDGAHIHLLAVGEEPRADSPGAMDGSGVASEELPGAPAGASAGIPAGEQPTGTDGAAGSATGGATGLVDLNTATLAELQSLPRIGPVLGQRILDWRAQNGPFGQPADLDAVPGIGPAMLEGILPLVVVR